MVQALAIAAFLAAPIRFSFDAGLQQWRECALDPSSRVEQLPEAQGRRGVLKVSGHTPDAFGAAYRPWRDWRPYRWLTMEVFVPADAPDDLSIYAYLKDKHYWWYQTPLLADPATGLRRFSRWRGRWLHILVDISPTSRAWQPGGHQMPWHSATFYPREFGIRVFSSKQWDGWILIDTICLWGHNPPLGKRSGEPTGPVARGLAVHASASQVPVYEKLELTFYLDRNYSNPFDPEVVDVTGHFLAPSGRKIIVPGFYYQDYMRLQTPEGYERLVPKGPPCWKVRFSPTEPGRWRYFISVKDALGEIHSDEHSFIATPPKDPRGLIRISKRDGRFFEFDNGDFFYPLGMNMRDGGDQAAAQRGTYDFDDFFPLFAEHNIHFVRTWMAAWWGGIEWSERYDSRYDGVGRYCLYNAWRLDHAFDLADKYDIYLQLTFNSHGQIRRDKFDAEWHYNPYSVKNGGFVASPAMFFTNEDVKKFFRQRYRYIVARWGYSRHLMTWELFNEVDLVEGYNPEEVAAWHQEMARYLRSIDPWHHLITTHICLYWVFGQRVFSVPEIQYVQADHYWRRKNHVGLDQCYRIRRAIRKPFVVIEYGPQTVELPVSPQVWQREFRVGMWTSNMLPSAMPAVFWYHKAWRKHQLWRYQKGLEKFNAGEDRRGAGWEQAAFGTNQPKRVAVEAMVGKPGARFYCYNWDNMLYPDPSQVPKARWLRGVELTIAGLSDGDYTLELWDPLAGEPFARSRVHASAGRVTLTLPPFAQEIAGKLLPLRSQ